MTADKASFTSQQVDVRINISALWASMLFVFAYVDLFGLLPWRAADAASAR